MKRSVLHGTRTAFTRSRTDSFRERSLGCQWQKLGGETRERERRKVVGILAKKRLIKRSFICQCHGHKSLCTQVDLGEGGKSSSADCERGRVCAYAMQPAALLAALKPAVIVNEDIKQ